MLYDTSCFLHGLFCVTLSHTILLYLLSKYGPRNAPSYWQTFHRSDMTSIVSIHMAPPLPQGVTYRLQFCLYRGPRYREHSYLLSASVESKGIIQPFILMEYARYKERETSDIFLATSVTDFCAMRSHSENLTSSRPTTTTQLASDKGLIVAKNEHLLGLRTSSFDDKVRSQSQWTDCHACCWEPGQDHRIQDHKQR